jgi:hypothetical protein
MDLNELVLQALEKEAKRNHKSSAEL